MKRTNLSNLLLPMSAAASLLFSIYFLAGSGAAIATEKLFGHAAVAKAVSDQLRTASPVQPQAVADVVAKALAFKATLTTAQQAVLERTYTTTLGRRWSNLPCGSGCRNGIQLGSLTADQLAAAQKLLVLEAMKPWVRDADDTVAANLLSIYQGELDSTFIAFTGSGVAGSASSFLVANTNYARIDGPSVWIEFACQTGVIYRNQIHYHTIWRDRQRDYGKDLSLTTPLDATASGGLSVTSAASFAAGTLAPEAIGTLFGSGLASSTVSATTTTLPTTLGGVQVQVKDSAGVSRNASLFYVSPTQISFLNPAGSAAGSATVAVVLDSTTVAQGAVTVETVTPGLFGANADGQGVAAAVAVRVKADGTQTAENLIQLNTTTNKFEAAPISVSDAAEQVILLAFGTGFRNRPTSSTVTATIGGASAPVSYAGAQGSFLGLDQANIRIPASLAGRGSVNVVLTVDGKTANTVTINIK